MAECRIILKRLTIAGVRSLSATVIAFGAPKMCPLLERSPLKTNDT